MAIHQTTQRHLDFFLFHLDEIYGFNLDVNAFQRSQCYILIMKTISFTCVKSQRLRLVDSCHPQAFGESRLMYSKYGAIYYLSLEDTYFHNIL